VGLEAASIGLLLGAAAALRFAVGHVGAELSDRVGRRAILENGMVLTIVALVVFPAVTTTIAFVGPTVLLAVGRLGNAMPMAMLGDVAGDRPLRGLVGTARLLVETAWMTSPHI
jgi:hypothetical protein